MQPQDQGRWAGPERPGGYDLTRVRPLAWWLGRRSWQFQLIVPTQILFWVVILVGFFGIDDFDHNFATTITWCVWFSLVFLLIVLTGRGWCAVCPFGGLAEWLQRGRFWHRKGMAGKGLGLNRPVPKWLARHGYITTAITFGILTWFEEYYEVSDGTSPTRTSWTVIGIIVFALIVFLTFERRAFCRYLCPLAGLIGTLGSGAPLIGFHTKDRAVCRACTTKECLRGNERAYGCPWSNWPGGSESNLNCGLCGECFRSCSSKNVGLYVDKPLTGLIRPTDRRADVAWTLAILGGIMVHQHLHQTDTWTALDHWVNDLTGLPHGPNPFLYILLSAVYTLVLVLPVWLASVMLYREPFGGLPNRGNSFVYRMSPFRTFFLPVFYAAAPLLAGDFLAVELMVFTQDSPKVLPAAGALVGIGAGGSSPLTEMHLMDVDGVIRLQVAILAIGALLSAAVMWRIADREITPVSRAGGLAKVGGSLLMMIGGALLIYFYIFTKGEAG